VPTRITTLALAAATLMLAGCSSGDGEDDTAGSAAPPPASATIADPRANDIDLTQDLLTAAAGQPWVGVITEATQTEPGRVEVVTSIVDPRGGTSGTPEAQQAIAVCNGTVAWLQGQGVAEPRVSVMESNGTSYVLYGHPSYPGGCTEV
jgi:hypothetical protein